MEYNKDTTLFTEVSKNFHNEEDPRQGSSKQNITTIPNGPDEDENVNISISKHGGEMNSSTSVVDFRKWHLQNQLIRLANCAKSAMSIITITTSHQLNQTANIHWSKSSEERFFERPGNHIWDEGIDALEMYAKESDFVNEALALSAALQRFRLAWDVKFDVLNYDVSGQLKFNAIYYMRSTQRLAVRQLEVLLPKKEMELVGLLAVIEKIILEVFNICAEAQTLWNVDSHNVGHCVCEKGEDFWNEDCLYSEPDSLSDSDFEKEDARDDDYISIDEIVGSIRTLFQSKETEMQAQTEILGN